MANSILAATCAPCCSGQPFWSPQPKPLTATATSKTKEEQLVELKRLFIGNLISKDAYAERQKVILSGS
ncbi:MAG: hypothetical protein PHS22_03490 [Rhodoferax sp.]|nr:hypothetical protein [Rhodoferax sp.]